MQHVFACEQLVAAMHFPTQEQSRRLLKAMYEQCLDLYWNAYMERCDKQTLLTRETGDNFRCAGRQQTEQDSFNFLNLRDLVTSPFGQFVNRIWRGPESQQMLKGH